MALQRFVRRTAEAAPGTGEARGRFQGLAAVDVERRFAGACHHLS
jgi:hypothetical protein